MIRLDELREVADRLERSGLRASAAQIRSIADANAGSPTDERWCPVQEPQGGTVRQIPWGLAERLYPAYGHGQTLERLAERGGFGRGELGLLAVGMYSGSKRISGPFASRYPLLDLYLENARLRGEPTRG